MNVKRIDPSSPTFPLPADYPELTPEGQRQARVNACRQWTLKWPTKEQKAKSFVLGIRFFDLWYLHADASTGFDPMFYDMDPLPMPQMHRDIYSQWATNRLAICIAPRGSAKSVSIEKDSLFETVSVPRYSIVYATSSGDNTKNRGQRIKDQFVHNSRLHDDFAPECPGGRLLPKRGEAPFGATHMQLMNGSWIRFISAESKQRGMRPRLYILDDPEYDPKASTSMQIIRDYMDVLLFKMVLPMVMRAGCGARWLATFVSRRHYAWHAMDVDAEGRARDPRFNNWDRMIIRSEYQDTDGNPRSCWPEMWPATLEERLRLAQEDPHYEEVMSLEEIKETIGVPNYLSEYMARPGEGDDVFFPKLDEEKHGYWFERGDAALTESPTRSEALICYKSRNPDGETETIRQPLSTWLRSVRLFQTVDTSYSAGPDSDSKVSHVLAVTSRNELFSLDLWSAQCHQPRLVEAIFRQAEHWRVPTVHIEAIKDGLSVFQECESIVMQRAQQIAGTQHLPGIRKINPGMTSKEAKIAAMQRRFELGLVKLPLRRRNDRPYRNLFNQIEEFNPDADSGGLQHDDELDTLAMHSFVVRGRVRDFIERVATPLTPLDSIARGEMADPITGIPHAHRLDLTNVNVDELAAAIADRLDSPHARSRSKV